MRRHTAVLALLLFLAAAPGRAQDGRTVRLDVIERDVTGDAVEASGGLGVVRITQGDQVELRWTTDEATELHLHGYNVAVDVAPGEEAVMAFDARAAGRFAVEAHGFGPDHSDKTLIYIEVLPR